MRTVFGLAILAVLALAGPPPDALAGEGKDALAPGDWEGEEFFRSRGSGGGPTAAPAPAQNPVPAGGGTATPDPEVGGEGGTATEPTGGTPPDTDEKHDGGGPAGGEGGVDGGGTPTPAPAPPPSCGAHWVLEQEKTEPDLVEEKTLLTLLLFRNDAYAFLSNGYARAESTWFVDWFTGATAGHDAMERYEVVLRLEGECPHCAPRIEALGTSFLEAKARVSTSWGTICARSLAKAQASTVWTGDLDASGGTEARVADLLTGSEAKLQALGVSISSKGTRDFVSEVATAGSGDQVVLRRSRVEVRVANKGAVRATAADVENNAQAKCRAGQEIEFVATTDCGAQAEFELDLVAR